MSDLTQSGIEALKAGKRQRARQLLQAAVQKDRYDVQAWLWLSACMDTPLDRRRCLEIVLKIDPENEIAKNGLSQLAKSTPTQQGTSGKPVKAAKKVSPPHSSGSSKEKLVDSSSLPYIPPAPDKSNVPKPYIPPARDKSEKGTYVPPAPDKSHAPETFIPEARDKSGEFIPDIQARDKSDELKPYIPDVVDPNDRQSFIPPPPPSPSARKNESRIPPPRPDAEVKPKWMSAMQEQSPEDQGGGVELEGGIYIPPGLEIGAVGVSAFETPEGQAVASIEAGESLPPTSGEDVGDVPPPEGTLPEEKDDQPKKGAKAMALVSLIGLAVLVLIGLGAGGYLIFQALPKSSVTPSVNAIAGGGKSTNTIAPTSTPEPKPLPTLTKQPSLTATLTVSPTRTLTPTRTLPVLGSLIESQMDDVQNQVVNLRELPAPKAVQRYLIPENMALQTMQDRILDPTIQQKTQEELINLTILGLVPVGTSVDNIILNRTVDNVGGAYLPANQQIFIFGPYFHLSEHMVYALEYARALLETNYKLDSLGISPDCQHTAQQCQAIRALFVGDARLVMYQWLKKNASKSEYDDLYKYNPELAFPDKTPLPFLTQNVRFLNESGYNFVRALYNKGGWPEVNKAYQNLPISTEQILHPEKYFAGEQPVVVPAPALEGELGKGWHLVDQDVLGEWMSYLLLAQGSNPEARLDDNLARDAVTGWGGDHYQIYSNESGDENALAVEWVWDKPQDEPKFADSLRIYLDKRFQGKSVNLGNGDCWEANAQVTCMYSYDNKTLWLLAPNRDLLNKMLGEYPDFQ